MVMEAYPTKVVGGTYGGSFTTPINNSTSSRVMMNYVVPAGRQLKILFMRYSAGEAAQFQIKQTNPTLIGQTGTVEAYPVVGSVPQGIRDRMRIPTAAAGQPSEHTDRGRFEEPIHVLEGSIDFLIVGPSPKPSTGNSYFFSWWGVDQPADV
jgi:hypothetical protein